MSTITDALQAARKPTTPPFVRWLETLDKQDSDALTNASTDPTVTTADLFRIIHDSGCKVGKETVRAWRKANGFDS